MDNKKKKVIRRRKWLTLEEKLKLIEAKESGKTYSTIAREQGMNESSVRLILRKKDFYKSLGTSKSGNKSYSRHKSLLLEKVEKKLIAWIEDSNQKRIQLTETKIQRKALALFNELKPATDCNEKFSASRGWIYRFKNRINLRDYIISSEKPAPDQEAAEKFRLEFVKTIEDGGYTKHQIFNVEETSLYWKKIPFQGCFLEEEKNQPGCKHNLTLLLGSNAAGDLKLKPMIVYPSETPTALRHCEKDSLPVIWRSNRKAWLTKELFEEWFTNYFTPTVESYCHDRGLEYKILLLLESTSSHDVLDLEQNIKVVFLPHRTASILQPMTLGVFPIFKANYLGQSLSQALPCTTPNTRRKFWINYSIKDAINNIHKCWCETGPDDLAASWHQLLPDVKPRDFESQVAAILQDVVTLGQSLGLKTLDIRKVQSCIDSPLQESQVPVAVQNVVTMGQSPGFKTEDIQKVQSCIDSPLQESHIAAAVQDVVTMGQSLGFKTEDVQKVQSWNNSPVQDSDSPVLEFEAVMCKDEMPNMFKDEDQECDQVINNEELEKILQNVDTACETIAKADLDAERSIKVRQALLNGIQPYRDLYLERNKRKCKFENSN